MKKLKNTFLIFIAAMSCAAVYAQKPRVSPPESVSGKVHGATITINYSSPSVKGRTIWGGLVPYDSVWRAGANEATTLETDQPITVAHKPLPAGKYGFFLVPKEKGKWIAVFNTVPDQWGAFKYDKTKDQLRVDVKTKPLPKAQEMLIYKITSKGFLLNWDKRSVFVPVN